jgi:O-antigen ligase
MKDSSRKYQHFFIQVGILVTFFIIPMWLRIPNAPRSFSRAYILGFVWLIPLTFTLTIWVSSGFLGIQAVARNRRRITFAFAILGLALWSSASQIWAFMRNTRPDMTLGVVGQMCLMALFAVMVLSVAPSPKWVVMALIAGMVAQGIIGAVQVTIQDDIGLRFLGEFRLDPAQGGVSVVQAGDVRWLRPYGLTPHPNIFAGYMLVGVLGALGVVMAKFIPTPKSPPHKMERGLDTSEILVSPPLHTVGRGQGGGDILGNIFILLFGLWMLFLTFSRGVWLGFAVALIGILTILTLRRLWTKRALRMGALVGIIMVGMGVLFVVLYYPFILARAGVNEEYVEMRAVNERAIHISIAYAAFEEEPVWGVGIGNFAWYSTYYLRYEMRVDMKGENIHNVYLLALTELGIIGLVLMLTGLIVTITKFPKDPYRLALWGGVVGLAMVGLFDHYTWSILAYGVLWWGIMAVVVSDESADRKA